MITYEGLPLPFSSSNFGPLYLFSPIDFRATSSCPWHSRQRWTAGKVHFLRHTWYHFRKCTHFVCRSTSYSTPRPPPPLARTLWTPTAPWGSWATALRATAAWTAWTGCGSRSASCGWPGWRGGPSGGRSGRTKTEERKTR